MALGTLTRAALGRLAAHQGTPIAGVSTAFSTGDWTPGTNITRSIVSSRLRITHAAAGAGATRYCRWTALAPRADVYLQAVLFDSGTLVRSGLMARTSDEAALPDDAIFTRIPNENATGGNRAVSLTERAAAATVQSDSSGTFTPAGPQRVSLLVRGTDAIYRAPGLPATRTLAGIALSAAGYLALLSSNDSASSSTTADWSELYASADSILVVNGPTDVNWRAALLDADDVELASVAAVAGVAEIDFDAEGIDYPLAVRLEIRDTDNGDALIGEAEPSETLWGGDEWTFTPAPAAPTGVTVDQATAGEVRLSWDAVAGAVGYGVFRGTAEGGPYTLVGSSDTPDFVDGTVSELTTYYYVVVAYDALDAASDDSAEVSATTLESFAPCTISLEVFESDAETIAWRVTTDPAKANPYLDRPINYGARELDPVRGAAVIATITAVVRDVAQTPGDQDTGFVTERLDTIYGRRCRMYRHPSPLELPVLIADGPAAKPRLQEDYASFAFEIRDTRESERKLEPFRDSATLSLYPFGPVEAWGPLPAITPIAARCQHSVGFGIRTVVLNPMSGLLFAETVSEEQRVALEPNVFAKLPNQTPDCDVLWRPAGSGDPWNQVFPALIAVTPTPIVDFNDDGETGTVILAVVLDIPIFTDNLPAHDEEVEFFIRYRGKPTDALPAYFSGELGDLLAGIYDRTLETPPPTGGVINDIYGISPQSIDSLAVRYDADALAALTEPVLLRLTAPIKDGREWAEKALYSPSGWIPAIDREGRISPVNRERPEIVTGPEINAANAEASSAWDAGERIVSAISYRSNRYFIPADAFVERGTDGVATREVEIRVVDAESLDRFGEIAEDFDASAFASVGNPDGTAIVDGGETVNDLVDGPGNEVIARYSGGAPCVQVRVRRSALAGVREGDFVTAALGWLPGAGPTRGLAWDAAQILMIEETDCAWCTLLLERSPPIAEGS